MADPREALNHLNWIKASCDYLSKSINSNSKKVSLDEVKKIEASLKIIKGYINSL